MVISGEIATFQDRARNAIGVPSLATLARFACAILLILLIAVPAEAGKKRKKVRHIYSPPKAAMVVDLNTGKVLFEEHADKARFPASITKVMTLYMLFEQMKKGQFAPDTELKVSEWAASRPPSKIGVKAGQTIKVEDAMLALVTKSANDVATVVAENIAGSEDAFARMMTHKARMIGMTDTVFANASGLPDERQKTTARDLITLGRRMLEDFPTESEVFQTRAFRYGKRLYHNHNRLLSTYAGMEGMKTGYTRASGFNLLASCRRGDKHLIAVVIGGSSSRQRNNRMTNLLDRSWKSAVAMNANSKRGPDKPLAIAGVVRPELLPERNPAFHTVSEDPLDATLKKSAGAAQEIDIEKELEVNPEDEAEFAEGAEEEGETHALTMAAAEAQGDIRPVSEPSEAAAMLSKVALVKADEAASGPYHVQVGSFLDTESAKRKLELVTEKAGHIVRGHDELTVEGDVRGKAHYRARFGKFSRNEAANACAKLKRLKVDCLVVRVE